jgi:molecular chaperone DnaK
MDLNRATLEQLVRPVVERCRGPVEQALHDAGRAPREIDRLVFVGGPTRMPAVRAFFEGIFGRPAETGVDPMECVASGAAIQAGVLAGEIGEIVLVDVTPLTLGVETLGGVATPLVSRNTPIPIRRTETFTTAADFQTSVTIHVFQGERAMAADNTSLGEFGLTGLPPAPRGVPKIEVTFDIDASGILDVAAKDTATGRSQSIRITGSTRLSDDEKTRMISEAERYAEEDRRRREEAERLNTADAACYEADKVLAEFRDKLPEDLRSRIEATLRETREALAARDAERAAERAETLRTALQEAGSALYAQAAAAAPTPPPHVEPEGGEARPSGAGPRGRVVEAEYEEAK